MGILLSLRTGCPAGGNSSPAGEGDFVTCLPLEAICLLWSLIRTSALEAHALLGPETIEVLVISNNWSCLRRFRLPVVVEAIKLLVLEAIIVKIASKLGKVPLL